MTIFPVWLVFYEIKRFFYLADIMIIGADLCQECICSDFFSCRFNKGCHDNAVMICSGGHQEEFLEDRLVQVAKFQELDVSCIPKDVFKEGNETGHDEP